MTVAIGFYRGRHSGNPFSRLLAWWQRSDYSHCAVVWQVHEARAYVSEATIFGGVQTHWRKWDAAMWDVAEVNSADRDAVSAWWVRHSGSRYDWMGLLGFIVRRIKGVSAAFWCSEAVHASLGWPDAWRVDVADLAVTLRVIGCSLASAKSEIIKQENPL